MFFTSIYSALLCLSICRHKICTVLLKESVLIYVSLTLCVCPKVNKTFYLLSMKGMFAWTNPQLVFLFELLEAHCTYLTETWVEEIFSEKEDATIKITVMALKRNKTRVLESQRFGRKKNRDIKWITAQCGSLNETRTTGTNKSVISWGKRDFYWFSNA